LLTTAGAGFEAAMSKASGTSLFSYLGIDREIPEEPPCFKRETRRGSSALGA